MAKGHSGKDRKKPSRGFRPSPQFHRWTRVRRRRDSGGRRRVTDLLPDARERHGTPPPCRAHRIRLPGESYCSPVRSGWRLVAPASTRST